MAVSSTQCADPPHTSEQRALQEESTAPHQGPELAPEPQRYGVTTHEWTPFNALSKERRERPRGLKTYLPDIDRATGGLEAGSLHMVVGSTGDCKTILCLNMAYQNAVRGKSNIVYISLTVPRARLHPLLLSCHSAEGKFNRYPIPHDRIRRNDLTPAEEAYLDDVIAPDLAASFSGPRKGMLLVLDGSDFESLDPDALQVRLEQIDAECMQRTGAPVDAFIWDHCQSFKGSDAFAQQLVQWALSFRGRPTVQVLVAQTSGQGRRRAMRRGGAYDLDAIVGFSEAVVASSRVLSIFVDYPAGVDESSLHSYMRTSVQLLKNSFGPRRRPVEVFVDLEYARVGEVAPDFLPTPSEMDGLFDCMDF